MPISLNITQSTGVIASYHKVVGYSGGETSLVATVSSYLNNTAGLSPIETQSIELGSVLGMPAQTPPTGATIEQVVYSILENALISQQTPNPASTTTTPLPLINGFFYGGSIVS